MGIEPRTFYDESLKQLSAFLNNDIASIVLHRNKFIPNCTLRGYNSCYGFYSFEPLYRVVPFKGLNIFWFLEYFLTESSDVFARYSNCDFDANRSDFFH